MAALNISVDKIKATVKEGYSKIAKEGAQNCCSCADQDSKDISKSIGYTDDEINNVPEANMGLGCGNPLAFSAIKAGDVVLDLGSGAGFDAFLAAKRVGKDGLVIGVDMTPEMVEKAKNNAEKYSYTNTDFRLGDIEDLPVEDSSVDLVISNCVINLAPDKDRVFSEVYRVLKKGACMIASDIVLLEELAPEKRADPELLCGCVGGAILKDDYLSKLRSAGFDVSILDEDRDISKTQYKGINLMSLKFKASKI